MNVVVVVVAAAAAAAAVVEVVVIAAVVALAPLTLLLAPSLRATFVSAFSNSSRKL